MLPKVTINEFKKVVQFNYDNNISRAVLGLGGPGIGKSEAIHQLAKENNIKYVDLRLLLFSETDLKGLPYFTEDKLHTSWLPNDFLPNAERDGERGILLIEELTSASKKVQAACYQLILDRKIGNYTLPDGWMIVALGNRQEDMGVYVQIPAPLANRFEIYECVCEIDDWRYSYAIPHGVNPSVVSYLSSVPNQLFGFNYEDPQMSFASPRSWKAVSDLLNSYKGEIRSDSSDFAILRKKIEANISVETAAGFITYVVNNTDLSFINDVLAGKDAPVPSTSDMKYIVIANLVSKLSMLGGADSAVFESNKKLITNIVSYIMKFTPEFIVYGLKSIIALNPAEVKKFMFKSLDSAGVTKFIQENMYLFS